MHHKFVETCLHVLESKPNLKIQPKITPKLRQETTLKEGYNMFPTYRDTSTLDLNYKARRCTPLTAKNELPIKSTNS